MLASDRYPTIIEADIGLNDGACFKKVCNCYELSKEICRRIIISKQNLEQALQIPLGTHFIQKPLTKEKLSQVF